MSSDDYSFLMGLAGRTRKSFLPTLLGDSVASDFDRLVGLFFADADPGASSAATGFASSASTTVSAAL